LAGFFRASERSRIRSVWDRRGPCSRSGTFPKCDGAHVKHNAATGDNVGPLIVTVPKAVAMMATGGEKTGAHICAHMRTYFNDHVAPYFVFPHNLRWDVSVVQALALFAVPKIRPSPPLSVVYVVQRHSMMIPPLCKHQRRIGDQDRPSPPVCPGKVSPG